MKNSIFARFACAFFIFWHFVDVLVLSTTWNVLFCSCVDDVSMWWQMFNFVFLCPKRCFQINSRTVRRHFSSIMTLNNWKMIAEKRSYIFRWRSRFRRRRVCLSSLLSQYHNVYRTLLVSHWGKKEQEKYTHKLGVTRLGKGSAEILLLYRTSHWQRFSFAVVDTSSSYKKRQAFLSKITFSFHQQDELWFKQIQGRLDNILCAIQFGWACSQLLSLKRCITHWLSRFALGVIVTELKFILHLHAFLALHCRPHGKMLHIFYQIKCTKIFPQSRDKKEQCIFQECSLLPGKEKQLSVQSKNRRYS